MVVILADALVAMWLAVHAVVVRPRNAGPVLLVAWTLLGVAGALAYLLYGHGGVRVSWPRPAPGA